MATLVHCDGRLLSPEQAFVPVFDRSFLYGDSVYETLRTYRGVPFDLPRHLARLGVSLSRLRIDPGVTPGEIARRVHETVAAANNPESSVRIIVSRGTGEYGLANFAGLQGAVYVIARPFAPLTDDAVRRGISIVLAKTRRVAKNALDPAIKSGNYLNSLLGLMEACDAGADDAVFLNERDFLTEASTSSLFLVKGGVVQTPPVSAGILEGVTRFHAIEAAREAGVPVEERDLTEADLRGADEIFVTSTLKEVLGVRSLDGRAMRDAPGPVTSRMRALLLARIDSFAG